MVQSLTLPIFVENPKGYTLALRNQYPTFDQVAEHTLFS
jgi:hypothetical protein